MADGKGGIGLLIGIGKPKGKPMADGEDDGGGEVDSQDMACKAMFKAIKADDYEGFKQALSDYLEYREEDKEGEESDDSMSSGEKKLDDY